jgi:hypothetical protein
LRDAAHRGAEAVVVTVVVSICSTPAKGRFTVVTVHPVAGLASVSSRTAYVAVAANAGAPW